MDRYTGIRLAATPEKKPWPTWVTLSIGALLLGTIVFFYAPGWRRRIGYKGLDGIAEDEAEERYDAVEDAIMSLGENASDAAIIRYALETLGGGGGSRAKVKATLAKIKRARPGYGQGRFD